MNPTVHHHPSTPAGRFDIYVLIHKALREFMGRTLSRLGAMDPDDTEERALVLDGVDALLASMRQHLIHENDYVHTAIEARRPGSARHTADDHLVHMDTIACLEEESRALREARSEYRAVQALRLYRHLAVFVGENLQHMQVEEAQNNAALWALYSDAELVAIQDRLLASIPLSEMTLVVRWMAASLSVPELGALFGEMRSKLPQHLFDALLGVARAQLDDRRWAALSRGLGRAPVPGLVDA